MPEAFKADGGSKLSRLWDRALFFGHFLADPRGLASPAPSSRRIGEVIAGELAAWKAHRVVELGCDEKLLCVERKPAFCRRLKARFGDRVEVVQGDALRLPDIVAHTRWEEPDAVVCSVPLLNRFGKSLCRTIAEALPPGALYLQVANYRAPVEAYFDIHKTYVFLANIPPEQLHCAVTKNGK
jgi:hypothetical protein